MTNEADPAPQATKGLSLELSGAGSVGWARVLDYDGKRILMATEHPAPPGAPLELRGGGGWASFRTLRCRRANEEGFQLEARPVNLSRPQRSWLEQLVS